MKLGGSTDLLGVSGWRGRVEEQGEDVNDFLDGVPEMVSVQR